VSQVSKPRVLAHPQSTGAVEVLPVRGHWTDLLLNDLSNVLFAVLVPGLPQEFHCTWRDDGHYTYGLKRRAAQRSIIHRSVAIAVQRRWVLRLPRTSVRAACSYTDMVLHAGEDLEVVLEYPAEYAF